MPSGPIWYAFKVELLAALRPDFRSDSPIYRQLAEKIRDLIQQGILRHGERLPATRELAGMLGLNRTTVSAAYELLEAEGLLKSHVGRGSFVSTAAEAGSSRIDWSSFAYATELGPVRTAPISFVASRPASELFPLQDFQQSCQEVLSSGKLTDILQLGSPLGYAPLREFLRRYGQNSDEILITSGCQQAIDLIQRAIVRPGDAVLVEDPVYPGLKNVFARCGARLIGVPVTLNGLDLDRLETNIRRERPRLLVVTPNFQNPTGTTLTLAARETVLRLARDHSVILLENDIYGDLRYEGESLPTLKQLDGSGDVIRVGSFSKIAFPGLRVGWIVGPKALISQLAVAKQSCDLHTDHLSQAVLFRFAESGRLDKHLESVLCEGRKRLQAVLEACQRFLPPGSRFTRPQGGMNLWVRLPDLLDTADLLDEAVEAGVSYMPGRYFAVARLESSSLRLSFAGLPPEKIQQGVAILGNLFHRKFDQAQSLRLEPAAALV
ncbi:MAG: PLP-dependent aminotransferase family protein [Bryobacteraceae bacterium]|nr:PLP-dependent aminotransferase family protein [Bryobacteraceae bacterium]MDW8379461.1 PLP-dependent aminotransferase family protein [Bryobacterales bacterium]